VLRSEAGQRLTVALKALNARIREIHGFNLAITRVPPPPSVVRVVSCRVSCHKVSPHTTRNRQVKDKLIVLSGKLDQPKRLKGSSAPSPSLRSFLTCDSP
jgi:hypothetical protein